MKSVIHLLMGVLMMCGVATVQAQITVSPAHTAFGDQQLFTESPPAAVVLGNSGNQPVVVDSITTSSPQSPFRLSGNSCGPVPFTMAAQSTCTLQFTFNTGLEGLNTGGFDVYSGAQHLAVIPMSGWGVQGELELSPWGSMNFPTTAVGTSSAPQTVQLTSTGSGPIQILSITAAAAPFARVGGTCATPPFSLPVFGGCTLIYIFSPTQAGAGQAQAVVFQFPPAVASSQSLTLSGDATQGSQTITFPAQSARTYAPGFSFPVDPPATSNSGLAVVYGSTTATVCTVSGSMVAVVAAGSCTLTASQSGNASWAAAAQQTRSFAIARASQTLTFPAQTTSSRSFVPGGTFAIAPPATSTTPNAGQPIVYSSLDVSVCTVGGSTVTMVSSGACNLAANQVGNTNYTAAAQVTTRVNLALFANGFETLP